MQLVGEGHFGKRRAAEKRGVGYRSELRHERHVAERLAVGKRRRADLRHRCAAVNSYQRCAAVERLVTYAAHIGAESEVIDRCVIAERAASHRRYRVCVHRVGNDKAALSHFDTGYFRLAVFVQVIDESVGRDIALGCFCIYRAVGK